MHPHSLPIALQAVLPADLARGLPSVALADARRLVAAVHRSGALPRVAPAGVRRAALEAVRAAGRVPSLGLVARVASRADPFVKYTFASPDGGPGGEAVFEAVRIPLERAGRFSVCVSSQAGCALGCAFCATGRLGLRRNLEAWEIVDQVRAVRADLPPGGRVHGVVFQGMGEPLANLAAVVQAVRVLRDPSAQAVDARAITVCTAGLPSGIRALGRELPAVRLALSIGSAVPGRRRALLPIDAKHPLGDAIAAAADHALATGLAPLFAYTLLGGVNDSQEDAAALAALARRFAADSGKRPRLTLLAYNPIGDPDPFGRSSTEREAAFRAVLAAAGFPATVRYSGGWDVGAACGQLAGRGRSGAA